MSIYTAIILIGVLSYFIGTKVGFRKGRKSRDEEIKRLRDFYDFEEYPG
jgi:hypothetical protein